MTWRFDHSYARLPDALFTRIEPAPVRSPASVIVNRALAEPLGLDADELASPLGAAWLAGNVLPPGAEPIAQAYAGHQFGHFAMLGDGRAVLLGELLAPDGRRYDLQLKGSGRTPYSRSGDGRAALGPMLREYVIGEAMHALGIPTTRALAVVRTGERIYRETPLAGAVLARVAASHIRVGTFQYAAALREPGVLDALLDHTIERHYPALAGVPRRALALLQEVIDRQCDLVLGWMRVGFIHGVMNTDNMTLSGETIDYGPCAFMDAYDPATTFSSIDHQGRYAFARQAPIAAWNLARLAEAMLGLIDEDEARAIELAQAALGRFEERFREGWLDMMRGKLGLRAREAGDADLAADLLSWMHDARADYTTTFRGLSDGFAPDEARAADPGLLRWQDRWRDRIAREDGGAEAALVRMRGFNPVYVPRNHRVEDALAAATERDDMAPLHALLEAVTRPFERRAGLEAFEGPAPASAAGYRTFCGT